MEGLDKTGQVVGRKRAVRRFERHLDLEGLVFVAAEEGQFDVWSPDNTAPLVAWLVSETSSEEEEPRIAESTTEPESGSDSRASPRSITRTRPSRSRATKRSDRR